MSLYKWALNECCWPGCDSNRGLDVHHIEMLKNGGIDSFENYVVLCKACHRGHRLHSLGYDRKLEVLIYKFYKEKLILGYCSDDYSDTEFTLKLRKVLEDRKYKADLKE